MSLNLYWRPAVPRKGKDLDDSLKFILREKFGNGCSIEMVFDRSHVPYLEGLRDAKIAGAQELLDAIEKHDLVEVYTE